MLSNTSAGLWIEPAAPLGDTAEVSGPFGAVCGALGADEKGRKFGSGRSTFSLPSSVTRLIYSSFSEVLLWFAPTRLTLWRPLQQHARVLLHGDPGRMS